MLCDGYKAHSDIRITAFALSLNVNIANELYLHLVLKKIDDNMMLYLVLATISPNQAARQYLQKCFVLSQIIVIF